MIYSIILQGDSERVKEFTNLTNLKKYYFASIDEEDELQELLAKGVIGTKESPLYICYAVNDTVLDKVHWSNDYDLLVRKVELIIEGGFSENIL